MGDFLSSIFDTTGFPPRWTCGLWTDAHGWLHIGSDVAIFGAYIAIPIVLTRFVLTRRDVPFPPVFWLFAAFIICCGTGHLVEAVIFWTPVYRLSGLIKLATALVSWGTVVALVQVTPRALSFRSPGALEEEVRRRTEELQAERKRFHDLYHQAPDMYFTVDAATGTIIECNETLAKGLGVPRTEVLGRPYLGLYAEEVQQAALEAHERLEVGAELREVELLARGAAGPIDISLSATSESTEAGVQWRCAWRDTSSRKRSERLFQVAVEASPSGMVATDRDGVIVLVNRETERLFGYDRANLIGQKVELLVPESMRQSHPALREDFAKQPVARAMGESRELFAVRKDGTTFPVEVGLNPIETVDGPLVLSAIVDRTELQKKEHALEARSKELKRLTEEREEFVYAVSHDLKSPLVTSAGFLEVLEEELETGDRAVIDDAMERLNRANKRMMVLINELLELSRIGRTTVAPETLETGAVLEGLIGELHGVIRGAEAHVTLNEPLPPIYADRRQFERTMLNLLVNALKYACREPGGTIEIGAEEVAEGVRLYVRDDGPGIPPELHAKVLRPFERASQDSEGTGMGLAIVDRVMHSLGGTIEIESDGKSGTTIWLSFPAEEEGESRR